MLVLPEQEREATLGRIRAYLSSQPETVDGEFTLPMLTRVLCVRQRQFRGGAGSADGDPFCLWTQPVTIRTAVTTVRLVGGAVTAGFVRSR